MFFLIRQPSKAGRMKEEKKEFQFKAHHFNHNSHSICLQRFDTNEEMVAHQAKHLTESKYKCELCGKHFPSQSSVWKHTKAHSGERPFVW
jgi:hypothetical protein